jgi:hypothetical protein
MTEEEFRDALSKIGEIARYDFNEELVWLHNGCREQMGLQDGARIKPSDKSLRAILTELEPFGNHPFALEFRVRYLPEQYAPSEGDTIPHTKGDAVRGIRDSGMPPVPAPAPAPVPVGGSRGEPDSIIRIGPDWRPGQNQIDNLVMGGALPEHAVEPAITVFRGINMGKADNAKAWDRSWSRWAPKAYRAQPEDFKPGPQRPEDPERRAREAAEARERHNVAVERRRARLRQNLAHASPSRQAAADHEQPTVSMLVSGIGGSD